LFGRLHASGHSVPDRESFEALAERIRPSPESAWASFASAPTTGSTASWGTATATTTTASVNWSNTFSVNYTRGNGGGTGEGG
jgi:hypothetical protein